MVTNALVMRYNTTGYAAPASTKSVAAQQGTPPENSSGGVGVKTRHERQDFFYSDPNLLREVRPELRSLQRFSHQLDVGISLRDNDFGVGPVLVARTGL
jgi:hypothetical protein